ncbi:MAG: hypothetical protein WJ306_04420 [Ferrovum myxofaciens]
MDSHDTGSVSVVQAYQIKGLSKQIYSEAQKCVGNAKQSVEDFNKNQMVDDFLGFVSDLNNQFLHIDLHQLNSSVRGN